MTRGTIFWVIMILLLLGGLFVNWPHGGTPPYPLAYGVVEWVLLALLGWNVFGPAVKG